MAHDAHDLAKKGCARGPHRRIHIQSTTRFETLAEAEEAFRRDSTEVEYLLDKGGYRVTCVTWWVDHRGYEAFIRAVKGGKTNEGRCLLSHLLDSRAVAQ